MPKTKQIESGSELSEEREFAMRLGTVMLHVLNRSAGSALGPIDKSGLTLGQTKALLLLASEGPEQALTVGDVADRLGISLPSASRSTDGLVCAGLVERSEDPDDRRVRRLRLTPEGDELAVGFLTARLDGIEEFTSGLDEHERSALDSALAVLLKRDDLADTYEQNLRRERAR